MHHSTQSELKQLSELIDLIYQGITDPGIWESVVREISGWIGSNIALIFTPLHDIERDGFLVNYNMSPQSMLLYGSKYQEHDLWINRANEKGLIATGKVLRDQQLATEEEFLSSRIYREFLVTRPEKELMGRLLTGIVFSEDDATTPTVICAFHRALDNPFTEYDANKLNLLIPHISRSLGVMFRLRNAEFKVANSLAAVDALPNAVLLIAVDGSVVFANYSARKLLAENDGLTLKERLNEPNIIDLIAVDARDHQNLTTSIQDLLNPDIISVQHFSRAVSIQRISGKPPYILNFSALPPDNRFGIGTHAPRAILFLNDSAKPIQINLELLKSTYGLSKAESLAAEMFVNADTVEEAAERLNVSINTVKTHLKNIYAKTNTFNRSKLLKLLLALSMPE